MIFVAGDGLAVHHVRRQADPLHPLSDVGGVGRSLQNGDILLTYVFPCERLEVCERYRATAEALMRGLVGTLLKEGENQILAVGVQPDHEWYFCFCFHGSVVLFHVITRTRHHV